MHAKACDHWQAIDAVSRLQLHCERKGSRLSLGLLHSKRSKVGGYPCGVGGEVLLAAIFSLVLGETVMDPPAAFPLSAPMPLPSGCTHLAVRSGLTDRVIGVIWSVVVLHQLITIIIREDIFFLWCYCCC